MKTKQEKFPGATVRFQRWNNKRGWQPLQSKTFKTKNGLENFIGGLDMTLNVRYWVNYHNEPNFTEAK